VKAYLYLSKDGLTVTEEFSAVRKTPFVVVVVVVVVVAK
jgi:hypothetical protein